MIDLLDLLQPLYPPNVKYYITCLLLEIDVPTTIFVLFYSYIYSVFCTLLLIFTFCDFCIPVKHGFLNVFPF